MRTNELENKKDSEAIKIVRTISMVLAVINIVLTIIKIKQDIEELRQSRYLQVRANRGKDFDLQNFVSKIPNVSPSLEDM